MNIDLGTLFDRLPVSTGDLPALPLAPLATASEMRELDRKSMEEFGIPGAVLMENAGRATVEAMERRFGPLRGKALAVFAGPGNNGGDGLVIARVALSRGAFPALWLVADPDKLPPDAALNWAIAQKLGLPCRIQPPQGEWNQNRADILPDNRPLHSVVDALFGIGLTRPLGGAFLEALRTMTALARSRSCPIVAVDMPSGLHTDTGEVLGEAARADLTVTYGLPKPAHVHNGGALCAETQVVDIGIPAQVLAKAALPGRLLDCRILRALPRRAVNAHKGTSGHTLVLAGSLGKTGAGILAAKGVLAAGAGLLSCALPRNVAPVLAASLPEAMYEPLPTEDHLSAADLPAISALCAGKQALVLGPGLGTHPDTAALVLALYRERPEPMVLDADALNILAGAPDALARAGGPRLFTPHPGEMARLLNTGVPEIQKDRLGAAQQLCARCGNAQPIVAVLKGAGTVLARNPDSAAKDGSLWALNTSGNPGMAAGGMGDVLAGLMAGLLAQGLAPWPAACAAVWLHGAGADILAKERPFGYTASEVADAVPRLFNPTDNPAQEATPC